MKLRAMSSPSVSLTVGEAWEMLLSSRDSHGLLAADTLTAAVRLPDGSMVAITPATPDHYRDGVYAASYIPILPGRHLATFTGVAAGSYTFAAWASPLTEDGGMPGLADLIGDGTEENPGYLGVNSWTDAEVQGALDAEAANQRRVCRIPAAYPADLREALMRRVARNLSMRRAPLAVLRGDGEGGDTSILPGRDPEIRRLEGPHRRLKVG